MFSVQFLNMLKTAFRREESKDFSVHFLNLLKTEESKHANAYKKNTNTNIPRGFLLINSLRLVDIFSDDSNFRFSFMTTTVSILLQVFF